ncbi:MAG: ATP-binding protein [Patescibacteria group bacterium]
MWKFAAVEAVAFFLYFVATLLGNAKYEFYDQLSFSNFLSYQAAKMLFLSGAQFALTVYAFLSWYYEDYTIRPGSIQHSRGVIFKKEKNFPTDSSTSITISSGLLGKLLHYGSIRIKNGVSLLVLPHISRPERIVKAIRQEYSADENAFAEKPNIDQLLAENEHNQLEFKSSLRFDYKAGQANRDIEKAAMKTIAAFMNSNGGYLVVGVSDTRAPLGLRSDYMTLQRKDSDGFENHFTQSFNSMIGPEFRNLVKLWFHNIREHDLCAIQVLPSPRPVYLKADNNEQFYMRTGNISTALKLSEIESYARSRWPQRAS